MRRLLLTALLLLPALAPASAHAQGIQGRWKRGNMEIVIAPCGRELCGTVVKASPKQQARAERGSGTELIGARLIHDIERTGPATYTARVFVADRNMHARGTIRQVSSDTLSVKGCVLVILCKSQSWHRVGR